MFQISNFCINIVQLMKCLTPPNSYSVNAVSVYKESGTRQDSKSFSVHNCSRVIGNKHIFNHP